MFKRIDHVAFIVKDRLKSIKFYEEHFGFKKYSEHDVPSPDIEKIVYLSLGDTVLELVHRPNSSGFGYDGYHFCLVSDSLDDDYERLKKAGVEVVQEPYVTIPRSPKEKGWKRGLFKGLDGELIEIRG